MGRDCGLMADVRRTVSDAAAACRKQESGHGNGSLIRCVVMCLKINERRAFVA